MKLRAGTRLRSAISQTEVVVVLAPVGQGSLTCGGYPMVPLDSEAAPPAAVPRDDATGTVLIGKRYTDTAAGIEVLVTRGGEGSLAFDGKALELRGSKALPSSD